MLWFGASRPRAFTCFRQGRVPRVAREAQWHGKSGPVSTLQGEPACRRASRVEFGLPTPFLSLPVVLQPAGGGSSPCGGLQGQAPSSRPSRLTPQGGRLPVCSSLSSESPARGTSPDLTTFLPLLPNYAHIFLPALDVQESFCKFPDSLQ